MFAYLEAEAPSLSAALAEEPEERYPSCRELAQAASYFRPVR